MKTAIRMAAAVAILPLFLTACLSSGGTTPGGDGAAQSGVLVSELTSICGVILGDQAEKRINQEWAKYPEAKANRSIIETMAEVLLSNPDATEQQGSSQYKKYMTCATGLLMANGIMK